MSDNFNDEKIKKILDEKPVPEKLSPESMKIMLDKFGSENRRKTKIKRNAVKILSIAAVLAITVGVTLKVYDPPHDCEIMMQSDENINYISNMRYAESYEDIYDYFKLSEMKLYKSAVNNTNGAIEDGEIAVDEYGIVGEEKTNDSIGNYNYDELDGGSVTNSENIQEPDYTDTYNQEEGVIEADIVKTDGKTIFYASDRKIRAAQVDSGKFTNVKTFADDIGYISELYLYDDMLIAISDGLSLTDYVYSSSDETEKTLITIYSKEDYSLIGQYEQEGFFIDIRLRHDGFIYLVTNENKYNTYYDELSSDETEKYIPCYSVNDEKNYLECSDILISDISMEYPLPFLSYINLSAFDLNSDKPYEPTDVKAVAGRAGKIYCSMNNLYITYGLDNTEITRFSIGEGAIIPQAGASVKGAVKDQFSMSEYNGYFRIAATLYESNMLNRSNNVLYVLDMNLDEVGKISDFGIDETIKSVNFNGDMAYVVTFRQTDPLYAIDLSDPANPQKTDELKITGYSSYMQNWADGMLLGFGESGDEDGNLNGVKLTMFDNSDPENLKAIDSVELNGMGEVYVRSEALYDRKALLISPKNNIIGIPIDSDIIYYNSYNGEHSYRFYSFEDGKFKELGVLSKKMNDDFYFSSLQRCVIIGDYVYALSNDSFISADIKDFKEIDSFIFPEEINNIGVYDE